MEQGREIALISQRQSGNLCFWTLQQQHSRF